MQKEARYLYLDQAQEESTGAFGSLRLLTNPDNRDSIGLEITLVDHKVIFPLTSFFPLPNSYLRSGNTYRVYLEYHKNKTLKSIRVQNITFTKV